MIEMFTVELLK